MSTVAPARRLLASTVSLLLALAAVALPALPAAADPGTPSVSVSASSVESGSTITVTGTGFSPSESGAPLGARPPLAGKFAGVYVVFGSFLETWQPSAGAPSSARKVAPGAQKWVVNAADVATIGGAAAGAVAINADGSFSVEIPVTKDFAGALADGRYGIYTYPGSGAVYAPFETYTPITFTEPEPEPEPEPVTPSVSVSASSVESGSTITVTGTGFSPSESGAPLGARPPLAGKFAGVYVVFGSFLETWQPSAGAPSSARKVAPGAQKWVVNAADVATIGGAAAGAVAINADGSFSVEIPVTKDFAGALADGRYGIYTYPGSGAVYAPFETYTPITFTEPEPEPVTPTVSVSATDDVASGSTVTVTGEGFGLAAGAPLGTRPPLAGKFAGVYVVFGSFLETWQPSAGAPSSARVAAPGATRWVVDPADVATLGGSAAGAVAIESDGSFAVEIPVTNEFAGALADGRLGIATYAGAGAVYAPFETFTPITFAASGPVIVPTEPEVDDRTPGSLSWGVKSSFRDYVTGSIAQGTVTVGGGAGVVGGAYWFPQAGSSTRGGTESASYRGSVTFTGHGGTLSLRLADPVIRVTGSSAVLSVVTATGRVDFATLALAGSSTDATGARTFRGVPATLTAAGAESFAGFYPAGTALDPVTFTLGAVNGANANPVVQGGTAATEPAPTPPATEGVESDGSGFVAGGTYTFTATGFQPGESGILAVIYSQPTLLADDLVADAEGTVTWTGPLPAGLTGQHTFTFQGSVDRGLVLQIAPAGAVGCPVAGAELRWGVMERFRAYIDGAIANGGWETAGGAEYATPTFSWPTGSGGFDAESGDAELWFAGSVRFTGHGGILDTTLADPRIVITGDHAALLLDVSGTTREGDPLAEEALEFATLDLAAAERVGGGDLVAWTAIPATLTAAGARALGSYEAGDALDPVDLRITLGAGCALPAAATEEAPATGNPVGTTGEPVAWPWILAALVGAAGAAAAVTIGVRRSRRA